MKFEKVSKETWEKYIVENMKGAPQDIIDEHVAAWDDIKLPRRATAGSAGYDFYAPVDITLIPGLTAIIPTGIKVDLRSAEEHMEYWIRVGIDYPHDSYSEADNYRSYFYHEPSVKVLQMYPRSSYGFKYKMTLSNTVGIIDRDYYNNPKNEGHILISCRNGLDFEGCPVKLVPDIVNGGSRPTLDMDHPETKKRILDIDKGTAFCQGIIMNAFLVDDDEPVEKERVGGIGSTTVDESKK